MIHENRPLTPAEALIHFGKKGMKWGHTTSDSTNTTATSSKGKSAAEDIVRKEGKTSYSKAKTDNNTTIGLTKSDIIVASLFGALVIANHVVKNK